MILSVFCVSVNGKISLRSIFPWEHGIIDLRVGNCNWNAPRVTKRNPHPDFRGIMDRSRTLVGSEVEPSLDQKTTYRIYNIIHVNPMDCFVLHFENFGETNS